MFSKVGILIGAMAILFVLALPGTAGAQQAAGGGKTSQTTEYSFDDDVVQGDLVRPDGEVQIARHKGKHSSLIKVRDNFIKEMLKSVEDL